MSRRLALLPALLLTAIAAVAVIPGSAGAAPSSAELTRASALANDAWGTASADPDFAGLWIDDDNVPHVAYRGSAELVATKRVSAGFTIHSGFRYTYRDLAAKRDAVSDEVRALQKSGIRIVEWGPHVATNRLRLSVADPTPAVTQVLRARFGADVEIEASEVPADGGLFSRTDDDSPWASSIFITNPAGEGCSSGPHIRRNGVNYLLTAAHCVNTPGEVFKNGNQVVGTANWVDQGDRTTDTAIITGQGGAYMYVTDSTYEIMSTTPWTSVEGSGVCFNGAYSGEICAGQKVIKTDYCTDITGRLVCGVATAGVDGTQSAGHGDSGGPVHIKSPRWAYAGTIIGAASAQTPCTRRPAGGRTCSVYVRFGSMQSILDRWGATL